MNGYRRLVVIVAVLGLTGDAIAAVYTWRDENGVPQFSDRQPLSRTGSTEITTIEVPEIETVTTRQLPDSLWTKQERAARRKARDKKTDGQTVVMYSAKWCGVCQRAKAYFKQHGVGYVERDIDESAEALRQFRKLGGRGVPLILVGQTKLSGFSAASFEQVYRNRR